MVGALGQVSNGVEQGTVEVEDDELFHTFLWVMVWATKIGVYLIQSSNKRLFIDFFDLYQERRLSG